MASSETSTQSEQNIRRDLCRLARFGANIADAYSCFIFLPQALLQPGTQISGQLGLGGYHSLSNDVVHPAIIDSESGLISWVAKHRRSIHVSPFERDSRTLGVYNVDQELKSFIGIPVPIEEDCAGVIACDSKKSFAFSKLQGKLLENLSHEVANTVKLLRPKLTRADLPNSWNRFEKKAQLLVDSLGVRSIELLRLEPKNYDQLEKEIGVALTISVYEQVIRLIQQALPPHFAVVQLPTGALLIVADKMMSGFCESRIQTVCQHLAQKGHSIHFNCLRANFRSEKDKTVNWSDLLSQNSQYFMDVETSKGIAYEYRRA